MFGGASFFASHAGVVAMAASPFASEHGDLGEPAAKRARFDDHDRDRAPWPATSLRAAADFPGFTPPWTDSWASSALPSSDAAATRAAAAQMDALHSTMHNVASGAMGLVPRVPTTSTRGSRMSNEQVTTAFVARPIRMADRQNQFASQNFRNGDWVFVFQDPEGMRMAEQGHRHFPNVATVATLEQVRAFEAAHLMYADTMYKHVGVRQTVGSGGVPEYVVVDDKGDEVRGTGAARRDVWSRWTFAGACVATKFESLEFPMVTVCTQGPAIMRNYWPEGLRPGMDIFLRGVEWTPSLTGSASADGQARTVKTVVPWPTEEVLQAYGNDLDAQRSALGSALGGGGAPSVRVMSFGPHRAIVEDPRKKWIAEVPNARLAPPEEMRVVGRVCDVYPADESGGADHTESARTGMPVSSPVPGLATTRMYYGDLRVNISASCGLALGAVLASIHGTATPS